MQYKSYASILKTAKKITNGYVNRINIAAEMDFALQGTTKPKIFEALCEKAYDAYLKSENDISPYSIASSTVGLYEKLSKKSIKNIDKISIYDIINNAEASQYD